MHLLSLLPAPELAHMWDTKEREAYVGKGPGCPGINLMMSHSGEALVLNTFLPGGSLERKDDQQKESQLAWSAQCNLLITHPHL